MSGGRRVGDDEGGGW
jgi:hypothetical protein